MPKPVISVAAWALKRVHLSGSSAIEGSHVEHSFLIAQLYLFSGEYHLFLIPAFRIIQPLVGTGRQLGFLRV